MFIPVPQPVKTEEDISHRELVILGYWYILNFRADLWKEGKMSCEMSCL